MILNFRGNPLCCHSIVYNFDAGSNAGFVHLINLFKNVSGSICFLSLLLVFSIVRILVFPIPFQVFLFCATWYQLMHSTRFVSYQRCSGLFLPHSIHIVLVPLHLVAFLAKWQTQVRLRVHTFLVMPPTLVLLHIYFFYHGQDRRFIYIICYWENNS